MRTLIGLVLLSFLLLIQCRQAEDYLPASLTPPPTATVTPLVGVALATISPPTAAIMQTTPTPLPTPAPTATPTPIIYQVEAGDTLLAIAIERRTTVDEILALNPGIQPELLQIGQPLQLPPPATAVFQVAAGTPIPIQADVTALNLYQTPVGSLWLLGEVTNQSEHPAENVQVEVTLLDATGQALLAVRAWTAGSVLPAAGRAPFAVLVNEPPAAYHQAWAAVVDGQGVMDLGSRYLDLAVTETLVTIDDSRILLEGQVENVGGQAAVQIAVVATLYDTQGRVTGYREILLPDSLPAGASSTFQMEITPPGGRTADYRLSVQALRLLE